MIKKQKNKPKKRVITKDIRFGDIVSMHMKKQNIGPTKLAGDIGNILNRKVNIKTVIRWIRNDRFPQQDAYKALIQALKIDNKDQVKFKKAYWAESDKYWKKELKEAKTFGRMLEAHRNLAHMTQQDLADEVTKEQGREKPYKFSAVSGWEKGRFPRDSKTIKHIISALKLTDRKAGILLEHQYWKDLDAVWEKKLKYATRYYEYIKIYRNLFHLTQTEFGAELARIIGIERSFGQKEVYEWENGIKVPSKEEQEAMADFFEIPEKTRTKFFSSFFRFSDITEESAKDIINQSNSFSDLLKLIYNNLAIEPNTTELSLGKFGVFLAEKQNRRDENGRLKPYSPESFKKWMDGKAMPSDFGIMYPISDILHATNGDKEKIFGFVNTKFGEHDARQQKITYAETKNRATNIGDFVKNERKLRGKNYVRWGDMISNAIWHPNGGSRVTRSGRSSAESEIGKTGVMNWEENKFIGFKTNLLSPHILKGIVAACKKDDEIEERKHKFSDYDKKTLFNLAVKHHFEKYDNEQRTAKFAKELGTTIPKALDFLKQREASMKPLDEVRGISRKSHFDYIKRGAGEGIRLH